MLEIPVELGARSYGVSVGRGLTRRLPARLARWRGRQIVVVSNARVWALHGRDVERGLGRVGPLERVLVSDGERHKSAASLGRLHDAFSRVRLARDGLVVGFGGGVITDLAGFAAATWLRGVEWVAVPTTLLAMVDAAIGGKVGINHKTAKNLIGAFHQPGAVLCDTGVLTTLPPRQFRNGLYEIVKCGLVADATLFDRFDRPPAESWGQRDLDAAIGAAVRVKADLVSRDEREAGARRWLNLGHTIGHALESATGYRRFLHGEAVGWGLLGATAIARERRLLSAAAHARIVAAIDRIGPRPRLTGIQRDAVLEAMTRDKKVRRGRLQFVLPRGIGRVVVRADVSPDELRRALDALATHEG